MQVRLYLLMFLLVLMIAACAPNQAETAISQIDDPISETLDNQLLDTFDPNNFENSAQIDNEWLPLQPGRRWVYEGTTNEDGELIPHRIEFTMTDLTKEVAGVTTAVAYVLDFADEELVEAELAFYAQDNAGNVWYLGEYPEEYEEGEFVGAPAWITGVRSARAGIKMMANPQQASSSYPQGWAPEVNWSDRGRVSEMAQETCVPADCYEDVMIIEEFSRDETNAFQTKYYVRGIGNVQVGWRGEDPTQEELELVEYIEQLDPETMAIVRADALLLEKQAYENSRGVYNLTQPARHLLSAQNLDNQVMDTLDAANFEASAHIDNQWLPLQPGKQWVYEGITVDEGVPIPHRIEFTVTELTKEIQGIQTAVAYVLDFANGVLVEAEIAFYAQDKDGNIWYMGEYPEEYEDGLFVAAPTWIAGIDGSKAGIKMMAEPQLGGFSYPQGWGPTVGWSDRGQVFQMQQKTCVPVECYENVMIIDEFSLDEPDAYQLKYYAPGMGNVRVGWRGLDPSKEELELTEYRELDADALASINAAALELEQRAYQNSPNVYGQTAVAEGP